MKIRCPHCHNAVEIVGDEEVADVLCPSCGSEFNLVPETQPFSHTTQTIGHFQLLEVLGKGAFGTVYKAQDTKLDRVVALKIPRRDQVAPEDAELFLREARAAAQLKHPHVVAIHEVGRENNTLYIVSDFIQGATLADRLTAGLFTARETAELCAIIGDALHHAHEGGVIHRDLKPHNIMLDGAGQPHIMDFGLAKREAGEVTMTVDGKVLGTAAYMSPEQARGEGHRVDRRTDVYSLGVILFELLTGERPFRGNVRMLLHQVMHDEPPRPRQLNGRLPRDLETIALKCLEKDPRRRYSTAANVAEELRRFLSGHAIQARPISRVEQGWRWTRRNPAWAALWSVLATSVLTVLIVVTAYSQRLAGKNRELSTAVSNLQKQTKLAADRFQSLRRSTYATKIQKTEDYWSDDPPNLERGEELLASLLPEGDDEDLRGFEWYFLKRLCRPIKPLLASGLRIEALTARDDGAVLVSNSRVEPIVAEYRDGKISRSWKQDDEGNDVQQFFFTRRGPWCAAVCIGNVLERRRWETPFAPGTVVVRMPDANFLTAIAHDGNLVAYAVPGGRLVVWNGAAEKATHESEVVVGGLRDVQFSPDAQWVLLRGRSEVLVIELATGTKSKYATRRTSSSIAGATFSTDSRRLALVFADASVDLCELRNTETKPIKSYSLLKFSLYPTGITFFPDGNKIALSSSNSLIIVLDLVREVPYVYRGHRASAHHLSISPDGKTLYSGSLDGEVLAWDPSIEDYRAHLVHDEQPGQFPLIFNAIAYSPDGRWLACGGSILSLEEGKQDTGRVLLVDVATRQVMHRIESPRPVRACSFSPDSKRLIYGEASVIAPSSFHEWDLDAARPAGKRRATETAAHSAAYLTGGRLLLGGGDGTLRTIGPASTEATIWKSRMAVQEHANEQIEELVASADGRMVFSKNYGHLLRLWNAESGQEMFWSAGHANRSAMTLSSNCDLAAWTTQAASEPIAGARQMIVSSPETQVAGDLVLHHRAILFDLAQRKIRYVIAGHAREILAMAISDDARRLATGDATGIIKLWDTETGSELLSMEGHLNGVRAIAFHPGGRQFASIGGDPAARIWWTE